MFSIHHIGIVVPNIRIAATEYINMFNIDCDYKIEEVHS